MVDDGEDQGGCEGDGGAGDDSPTPDEWRDIAIQADALEKSCGHGKGKALSRVTSAIPSQISWRALLQHGTALAQAAQGRDYQSWSRRGRRSGATGPQFAGWRGHTSTLCAVVDSSGSMSDKALDQCAAECAAASDQSGVAIYLIVHDSGVQWEGWIKPGKAAQISEAVHHGRGGTSCHEAYQHVDLPRPTRCRCDHTAPCTCHKRPRKFDVFVHLTDCGLSWPSWPKNAKRKIVARTEIWGDPNVPSGATVIDVQVGGDL